MLQSKRKWIVEQETNENIERLSKELQISEVTARLLWNRGITSAEEALKFLHTEISQLHDPFLMDGMETAVNRIKEAVSNNEKVLVFGDYDADGVSSTSIMIFLLKELKAEFGWYIPNRFTEGYGPNIPAFEKAKEEGVSLVITVDTGIAAVKEIAAAKELGIDVIVTDHHEPPPELPEAYCIINPKKPGCPYPFKELAGVGVAFKLAHALLGRLPEEWLDIVAIGTISDLVPLIDENRVLATYGLRQLTSSSKPGIQALKKLCGVDGQVMEADNVGFAFGPRLNAAGRLDSADPAVHLLTTSNAEEAEEWAEVIDDLNKERQEIVSEMTKEAVEEVERAYPPESNSVLIIAKEGWNPGVIGIVASRLTERFYRPVIVMAIDPEKGEAKGSARSIKGFDMFKNLSKNRDILPHFGGHPMAAGLTMKVEDIEDLRARLISQANEEMSEEDFIPVTSVDMIVPLEQATLAVIEEMKQLEPYGIANPKPKIMLEDVDLKSAKKIGSNQNHLKMLFGKENYQLEGVGFHLGYLCEEVESGTKVSAVGELSINEWNGYRKPQFFLEDLAVREWQLFDRRREKKPTELLKTLPSDKTIGVAFERETVEVFGREVLDLDIIHVSEIDVLPQKEKETYIVMVDLPKTMEEFSKALKHLKQIERVYLLFKDHGGFFFETRLTRDHFKWFYGFLKKQGTFDLKKHGELLAKKKGWSSSTVSLMAKVFSELDFVTINNGLITVQDAPAKRDLKDSPTYRSYEERTRVEQELLYASYKELKNQVSLYIGEQDNKEKVEHGF
ncbi:single-stranded-DNA-specific exonuclease RecJ [Thalassorhabdus alkalitolerans]|uniref:Single-stranded-DNA-specific exonuclease RecJ n=1 Tax=Thalassorhabdus alkalitolerans TaxID=2282697 RepID=A0ABW0YPY8_9BACI